MSTSIDDIDTQRSQAIVILNQCRHQVFMNKPEIALSILEQQSELHKWLFCTKEIVSFYYYYEVCNKRL